MVCLIIMFSFMFVFFIVSICCLVFVLYSRVGRLAIVIEDIDSRCFCLVLLCYDECVFVFVFCIVNVFVALYFGICIVQQGGQLGN